VQGRQSVLLVIDGEDFAAAMLYETLTAGKPLRDKVGREGDDDASGNPQQASSSVIGVVERRQTMPILANVLVAARGRPDLDYRDGPGG
jgi:hypothetical protein